ncbi:heterokaryon incompatibility protein-domain-containing protein [Hypoxylon rubiginosum]|uniref:Heterokaryon incompatibility protein-domain-containing protein n=1 Tax=Hypoxylon rubiginosum TaxID=110542 RepID=A0ACB9ZF81_9PEZI|nr:heterokaryon incompatibility protein-domain-containing protein [Hypoxylon rubiginosum]
MSTTRGKVDDMQCSLWSFGASRSRGKITTQLEDIQRAQMEQEKSREFITHLNCLYFSKRNDRILFRRNINAYQRSNYVALSYTWEPSPSETDLRKGGYSVQQMGSNLRKRSPVRDTVFTRARKYMKYFGVYLLWIDQHCIEQKGDAKEIGMNAMDRVYSRSNHSVALLTRPINYRVELQLLVQILYGRLVWESNDGLRLSQNTSLEEALGALELLKDITSDMWFTRGWTFQENYRAGMNMRLLMPHHPTLESSKPQFMGSIKGELCISSVKFHEEASKLCIAYRRHQPPPPNVCDHILSRAGRYTILLQYESDDGDNIAPQSMSPRIIADLATRDLTNLWDRLPIVANCCQYSVRLNSAQLRAKGYSLAMSMLALCLLNGEILSNHPDENVDVSAARALPIIKFLKIQFFDRLQSPFPDKALTYNKGCRLVNAKLTEEGIRTRGHVWKFGKLIRTRGFGGTSERRNSVGSVDGLEDWEIGRLRQLVRKLYTRGEYRLARRLNRFISQNCNSSRPQTFSQGWMVQMASVLADAIDHGKKLRTARLVGSRGYGNAIFVLDRRFKDQDFVFTSVRSKKEDSQRSDFNDVDKHVSLEVDLDNPEDIRRGKELPRLFTKRWIAGLCFFSKGSLQDVVFPWPESLQDL